MMFSALVINVKNPLCTVALQIWVFFWENDPKWTRLVEPIPHCDVRWGKWLWQIQGRFKQDLKYSCRRWLLQSQDTFPIQQGLKWSIVIPQASSSPCSRPDRPFNWLIQITCHRGAEFAQWHLLIICPAPVHTSACPFRGSDCLSVPSAWPWFILTFYQYPCLLSFMPAFHTPLLALTFPPISISISTLLFISAPHLLYLCMWACRCSLSLLASVSLRPICFWQTWPETFYYF